MSPPDWPGVVVSGMFMALVAFFLWLGRPR